MSTEQLIIELDAKTAKLDAKLSKVERSLDGVEGQVKKTDSSLVSMGKAGVAAAGALAVAFGAVARQSAIYAKELLVASQRSNETVENMQAQAFAANSVGISLEKLGDIGKDTQEKIGEFLATGGGGFQDFADVMGLTTEQATKMAQSLEGLSSSSILQTLVDEMERGGVTGQQMSFALEGLASDTTDLLPLLTNGGAAMRELSDEFFNIEQTLTELDLQKLTNVGEAFNVLGAEATNAGAKISAEFSQEIITATALIANLVNVSSKVFILLGKQFTGVGDILGSAIFDLVNDANTLPSTLEKVGLDVASKMVDLFGDDSPILKALGLDPEEIDKKMKEITGVVDEQLKKVEGLTVVGARTETDADKKKYREKISGAQASFSAIGKINEAFLDDNKAINAGLIVADTAAGIMKTISKLGMPAAIPFVALTAATGLAQLASLQSSGKGGGSISAPSAAAAETSQESFSPEQSEIGLDFRSEESNTANVIRFDTETGDQLIDALMGVMNDSMRNGRG